MTRITKNITMACCIASMWLNAANAQSSPNADEIVRRADARLRGTSNYSEMTIERHPADLVPHGRHEGVGKGQAFFADHHHLPGQGGRTGLFKTRNGNVELGSLH